jgi:hypothetical protein
MVLMLRQGEGAEASNVKVVIPSVERSGAVRKAEINREER